MNSFKKLNVRFSVILFCLSCTVVFGQQNQNDQKKQNQTNRQTDTQKKQADVFDASTATLEETQNWLKNTLVKYGTFGSSRVESIKFKGCEMSYKRSNWYNGQSDFSDSNNAPPKERIAATDFRNSFPNYSESVNNKKVNLTQIDVDKTEIIEKGKIFSVWVYPRDNANKETLESEYTQKVAPSETRDNSPTGSSGYFVKNTGFVVTNKEVANQVKDALGRAITLCQQKQ